jgi:hypothetical protein
VIWWVISWCGCIWWWEGDVGCRIGSAVERVCVGSERT